MTMEKLKAAKTAAFKMFFYFIVNVHRKILAVRPWIRHDLILFIYFILGYNYSPLLTLTRAYKQVLSYGRCQTPLLNLVGLRDAEIANFKSTPYWNIEVTYSKGFSIKSLIIRNCRCDSGITFRLSEISKDIGRF